MRLLRVLSLDVVAGAACGGLLAEHAAGARMRPAWWIALLAAVWSIYTADHLLDTCSVRDLHTERHRFHRRHFQALCVVLGVAVVAGLAAAMALRPAVLAAGAALAAAALVYLVSAQGALLGRLPKEPVAALLYTAGVWSGPLLTGEAHGSWPLAAAGLHGLAAFLNLLVLGVFETAIDREQAARSLALAWGPARARMGAVALSLLGLAVALVLACLAPPPERAVFAVLAILVATPAVMLVHDGWFGRNERYRAWGDSAFLLGALPRLLP
jgi:hypothetical protein